MGELLPRLLLLAGALLTLLGALGVLRFPDPLLRMQAATKASTLGVSAFALACVAAAPDAASAVHGLALLAFVILSGPVAGQSLARAAWRTSAAYRDQRATADEEG